MDAQPIEKIAGRLPAGRVHIYASAVICLACLALFMDTVGFEFVWDDFLMLHYAPEIRSPLNLKAFFTTTQCDLYRPFGVFTNALIYAGFRLNPAAYHGVNVALYTLCCLLFYRIAFGLFKEVWPALAAALLFAAHPLHAEPVAWVSGMEDLLSGALIFAALLCFMRDRGGTSVKWTIPGVLLFALALLSKELSVMFPALVVALDLLITRTPADWKYALRRASLFVLSAVFLMVRFFYIGAVEQAKLIYGWAPGTVVPSVIRLIPHYLGQFLYPAGLCPDFFSYRLSHGFAEPAVWGTIIGIPVALAVFFYTWRRAPLIAFPMAWCGITLMPFLHIIPIGTFCADRFMFLPSAGLILLLVYGVSAIARKAAPASRGRGSMILIAICGAIGLFWGMRTPAQNRIWKDELTLYTAMTQCAPRSYYSLNKLGYTLAGMGRLDEAEAALTKANNINPRSAAIWMNLGDIYGRTGRYEQAAIAFRTAHALEPGDIGALMKLGLTLERLGRVEEAAHAHRQALRINPNQRQAKIRLDLLEELIKQRR